MHGSPSGLASAWPTAAGRSSTNAGVTASVFEKLRVRTGSVAVRVVSPYGRSTFMTSGSCETDRGSRTPVDPAVLVPGEHDLLDVEARLVERDLLDERLDVTRLPRLPPLPQAVVAGVVRRHRQPRIAELLHEAGEKRGAQLDVRAGILEQLVAECQAANAGHRPSGPRHELHEAAGPGPGQALRVVPRPLAE